MMRLLFVVLPWPSVAVTKASRRRAWQSICRSVVPQWLGGNEVKVSHSLVCEFAWARPSACHRPSSIYCWELVGSLLQLGGSTLRVSGYNGCWRDTPPSMSRCWLDCDGA